MEKLKIVCTAIGKFLVRLGKALMLPIAVLPIAGLLLRLGQPDLLNVAFISQAGGAVFTNLPIIFAIGVAIGFAKENHGAAALAAFVGYVILTATLKTLDSNINMDIMFAIPGQSMKMWKDTVRQCIFLKPAHISLYSLQIEEGTEFYELYKDGKMEAVPEIQDREMYHQALAMMKEAGYKHYEISNAALPGFESRHNLKYWSYAEYLGLGLGASSFAGGSRFKNTSRMHEYLTAIREHVPPVDQESIENYSQREEMGIFVFTGLRKAEGFSLDHFHHVFRKDFFDVYDEDILKKYKGLLICADGRLYLSEHGMDVSNRIMAEFV